MRDGAGQHEPATGVGQHTPGDGPGGRDGMVAGIVGLGTMGGSMARHLLEAGFAVVGHDVADGALRAATQRGAGAATSAAAVADAADVVILSLPSVNAFEEVIAGPAGIASASGPRASVVVETSTLPLATKEWGRQVLARRAVTLLDCPISGTGAQMAARDAVFYASGDAGPSQKARPVLAACAREVFELGTFGNGTRLKLVANHLVAIHNAAAAEALVLAERAGIDPSAALPALTGGAGTSRMLELRGPMMAARRYGEATMKVGIFQKDIDIITAFASGHRCPVPVFAAAAQLNLAALATGHGDHDTASVHTVVETMAGQ